MIRPLSSEFSILLSDVKSQLAGRTKTSYGPHEGADTSRMRIRAYTSHFNPQPRAGADRCNAFHYIFTGISIHGPRGGPTKSPPCCTRTPAFQSTAPWGGPTTRTTPRPLPRKFQSTAPVGADLQNATDAALAQAFQSTAPVWGPTVQRPFFARGILFQSTAPVWGPTGR